MSQFISNMAEESEGESSGSEINEPKAKKLKKTKVKKRHVISSDEEDEEEEDESKMQEEMKDFIVDNPEESEGGENEEEDDKESDKSEDEFGELSEEDLDVINENLGIEVGGRVQLSEDEDEDDRQRIEKDLFDRGGESPAEEREVRYERDEDESRSESEMSEDPFIVQDDAEKHQKRRRKVHIGGISDHVVDEAREVFGVDDFNIDEFYEEDDEEEEIEGEEELLDEEGEELEEGMVRERRPAKVKSKKETLMSAIEPSDLEKGFVSAQDKKILFEDKPERFQLRKIPVTDADDDEISTEAKWIYDYCFNAQSITAQHQTTLSMHWPESNELPNRDASQNSEEAIEKIKEALLCIRKQIFEVPFIAFYRKECIQPTTEEEKVTLSLVDLWRVYDFDEKWCMLQQRKEKLKSLMEKMSTYMREIQSEQMEKMRKITPKDELNVDGVKTMEELADVSAHFHLYYGHEIPRMIEWEKVLEMNMGGEETTRFKMSGRTDKFQLCVQCGLAELAAKFGLTPEQYAENLSWMKHDIVQDQIAPLEAAKDYLTENFPTPEDAIKGATYMVAIELSRQPAVRAKLRSMYKESVNISVKPTKKGREMIDESHPLFAMKYLSHKPVNDFKNDEYLLLFKAQTECLIEMTYHVEEVNERPPLGKSMQKRLIYDEFIQNFQKDEFHFVAEEWNKLRKDAVLMCCREMLLPAMRKELHEKMLQEGREYVLREAANNMHARIMSASYQPLIRHPEEDNEDEDEQLLHPGTRILAIAYSPDPAVAAFAVIIDQSGVVIDHLRLVHFTKRVDKYAENDPNRREARENSKLKLDDMKSLKDFVKRHKPHVVVIGAEDFDAVRLRHDILDAFMEMQEDRSLRVNIPVEIIDNEAAKVYMNSQMAHQEFPTYPPYLKQAVSLARILWDPLVEYSHLCNPDNDILYCKFHPLQDQIPKKDLLNAIQIECINRVNEVGVDINHCMEYPHTANMLQFVCGLGPRKAGYLLKLLKQNDSVLESRTKLVTMCRMGPKVFMNCAGFIKIATDQIQEKTESYVEVLDSSRVHPETYEWARKMAVDALEADDNADPTSALEEILNAPDKLKDLDLDAFADELHRQGFGQKVITLYDIRAELTHRYKDCRPEWKRLNDEQMFHLLTRSLLSDFKPGRLMCGKVQRVVRKVPTKQDIDRANDDKVNNDDRGNNYVERVGNMWRCKFCNSFEAEQPFDVKLKHWIFEGRNNRPVCPGKAIGINIRFDNGMTGFVRMGEISDNVNFTDPLERVKIGSPIYCRILRVDFNIYSRQVNIDCSTKSSVLRQLPEDLIHRDPYYDQEQERADNEEVERAKQAQHITTRFVKRVISHPSFHNVTCKDAEKILDNMELGEAIIRPSSLGVDFLTVTWKVAEDIYQHIVVREKGKKHYFNLGSVLYIGEESFEDLDEILARHIQPMAAQAREVLSYKYYLDGVRAEEREKIETHLQTEKKRNPTRIPYAITASFKYGGKFVISYMPSTKGKVIHEYFTLTPEGIRFRKRSFNGIEDMVNWFKVHFRELPQQPQRRMDTLPDRTPAYSDAVSMSHPYHHAVLPPQPPIIKPPPPNPALAYGQHGGTFNQPRQRVSRFEPMDTSGSFGVQSSSSGFGNEQRLDVGRGASGSFGQDSRFGSQSGFGNSSAFGSSSNFGGGNDAGFNRRGGGGFRGGRGGRRSGGFGSNDGGFSSSSGGFGNSSNF